jgi:uncharacterized protein with gpF-like domain
VLRSPKDKLLPAIHANAGLEAIYRKRLVKLIDEMANSIRYWVGACFKANQPALLAMDADPADELQAQIDELRARWQARFDQGAEDLASWFAKAQAQRTDFALKQALKKAGFSIGKFKPTKAQRDVMAASINANVSLIKSIPQQYLTQVEGSVQRAVQQGMNLGELSKELQAHHGVTKRRAALISRDQGAKAGAALKRSRELELGLTQARWVHSSAGKTFRPSHAKAGRDKVVYDIATGWYDPDEKQWIQPSQLLNCRCTGRTIIPSLE